MCVLKERTCRLLLGAIHALLGLIRFACLIAATQPIARFLKKPSVVQTCDRLTGGMFVVASFRSDDALEPGDLAFRSIETFVASLSRRISHRVRPAINSVD
jgi:hypothetical protein